MMTSKLFSPDSIKKFFDRYVFYSDTNPEEREAFRQYIRENTVEMAFPLFGFLAIIVLLFWPTDFFILSDDRLFRTYVIWRSCTVGGIALLLLGLRSSEFLRRYVNVTIVTMVCLVALGIGYAYGRISGVSEPWFWAILIVPWITLFLGLQPVRRFLATLLLMLSYAVGFFYFSPENLAYSRLTTVVILLSGMVFIITIAGHVLYHFMRQDFFHKRELEDKKKKLRYLARYDQLTDLYNRRVFENQLETEFERANRYDLDLTLLMIDLDHFKEVNDTYGHQAGDDVLETFGSIIEECTRSSDVGGRYGGEEFCVILPETGIAEARKTGERLRESLADQTFKTDDGTSFTVTCSIGLAQWTPEMNEFTDLVKAADEALYDAKNEGRNQVVVQEEN